MMAPEQGPNHRSGRFMACFMSKLEFGTSNILKLDLQYFYAKIIFFVNYKIIILYFRM